MQSLQGHESLGSEGGGYTSAGFSTPFSKPQSAWFYRDCQASTMRLSMFATSRQCNVKRFVLAFFLSPSNTEALCSRNSRLHELTWVGWTSNSAASSETDLRSVSASITTVALKAADKFLRCLLIWLGNQETYHFLSSFFRLPHMNNVRSYMAFRRYFNVKSQLGYSSDPNFNQIPWNSDAPLNRLSSIK